MSKYRQISRVMLNELYSMQAYGEKKSNYQEETRQLREECKRDLLSRGYSQQEANQAAMQIYTASDKVFCDGSMRTFEKGARVFEKFCIDKFGTARISMDTARESIQDFVYWCQDVKGYSNNTTHTHLAAVCKIFGEKMGDYDKPQRSYAENTRGRNGAIRDGFNAHRAEESIDLNTTLGLRRDELAHLKCSDIVFSPDGNSGKVYTIGKGGKHNVNILLNKEEVMKVQQYIDQAQAAGREYIFSKEQMNHDANLHKYRAERASYIYDYVKADIERDPSARGRWQELIKQVFHENGKVLKENLDRPYIPRGKGREHLIEAGLPLEYDRTALMASSVFCLNHFRSDVSFQNYIFGK